MVNMDKESRTNYMNFLEKDGIISIDAEFSIIEKDNKKICKVIFDISEGKPAVNFNFNDTLNADDSLGLAVRIKNTGTAPVTVYGCIDGNLWCCGFEEINPSEVKDLIIQFIRKKETGYMEKYFTGMNGLPGGAVRLWDPINPSEIKQVRIFLIAPEVRHEIEISSIEPYGKLELPDERWLNNGFFPFIDEYGQYMHKEWPGKVHCDEELKKQAEAEMADLQNSDGPSDWNKYGGWESGPQLNATGNFRVEKYKGKWWLVDPEGRLFWSHGINCVNFGQDTRIEGREHYFKKIPESKDFKISNLVKKYGSEWKNIYIELVHKRFRSWGMNTLGNWSSPDICSQGRTPYVAFIETRSWIKREFPDVGNPVWMERFKTNMERVIERTSDDPWCIGYFVDNEIHGSKDSVMWERYYYAVREKIKAAAPHKLYLGSRLDFHWYPDTSPENAQIVNIACKYCDVVSFNMYRYTLSDFKLPEGIDKPVIIGEFHVGALDRGLPHTGLRAAINQEQRARAYINYVSTGINNPYIVGTHWFQYSDQLYTGRFDGENYQIGFVDICDTPYPELVKACRTVGYNMYEMRMKGIKVGI